VLWRNVFEDKEETSCMTALAGLYNNLQQRTNKLHHEVYDYSKSFTILMEPEYASASLKCMILNTKILFTLIILFTHRCPVRLTKILEHFLYLHVPPVSSNMFCLGYLTTLFQLNSLYRVK